MKSPFYLMKLPGDSLVGMQYGRFILGDHNGENLKFFKTIASAEKYADSKGRRVEKI